MIFVILNVCFDAVDNFGSYVIAISLGNVKALARHGRTSVNVSHGGN